MAKIVAFHFWVLHANIIDVNSDNVLNYKAMKEDIDKCFNLVVVVITEVTLRICLVCPADTQCCFNVEIWS